MLQSRNGSSWPETFDHLKTSPVRLLPLEGGAERDKNQADHFFWHFHDIEAVDREKFLSLIENETDWQKIWDTQKKGTSSLTASLAVQSYPPPFYHLQLHQHSAHCMLRWAVG